MSSSLFEYLQEIDNVLAETDVFLKTVIDLKDSRIEKPLEELEEIELIFVPDDPMKPLPLLEQNIHHRLAVERKLAEKSIALEIACVELINKFIDQVQIKDHDENGKRIFQLPPDQITPENQRQEEVKPVDKYDWISFEHIFKGVTYPSDDYFLTLRK
jgi:dynein heavy chain